MVKKDSSGDLGERIMAAMERNQRLLENAGLPKDVKWVIGRRFLFYYAFNGQKEVTTEGTIASITITKQKNGTNAGLYIHLVPSSCVFGELPVLYLQLFASENGPKNDPAKPIKCGIFLSNLGKSLHTEFDGHLVLV